MRVSAHNILRSATALAVGTSCAATHELLGLALLAAVAR